MTTITVRTELDRTRVTELLHAQKKFPFRVTVSRGRSLEQNRLQRLWLREAQDQGDQTAEEYRGYCKLYLGVPILRAENEDFKKVYDRVVRPLDYETKLAIMMIPLDLPVTRLMTTKQKTCYLNAMYQHFTGIGFHLTEPAR